MISIVNLQEYLHNLEEAKKRDHRRLGQQQELFFFHDLRWCHGLTIFCMHYMVVRFVLKIAAGLFISDLSVYSLFFTMLNVSVQGAVSFYRMGQGSTTSCNHLSGKNTRKEVMKRCKYSSFLSVVHSTNYSSNSWLIYVCLWHLLSQAGLSDDPILVVYMWRLYWQKGDVVFTGCFSQHVQHAAMGNIWSCCQLQRKYVYLWGLPHLL